MAISVPVQDEDKKPVILKTLGHRILIRPDAISEQTEAGLFKAQSALEREQLSMMTGEVIMVGEQAWTEIGDGTPWAKVGDRVHYCKFAGFVIDDEAMQNYFGDKRGTQYRIMNDEDLLLAWTKDES